MTGRWTVVWFILAAGAITIAAVPACRIISNYLALARKSRNNLLSMYFGAAVGWLIWPVALILLVRFAPPYYRWLADAPSPLNCLADPTALIGFSIIMVGIPIFLLKLLGPAPPEDNDS